MFRINAVFILILFIVLQNCSSNTADKESDKKTTNALFLNQLINSTKITNPTCETASPKFSTLKDAGFETNCGSCHNGTYFQATSYSSVQNLTTPGTASSSKLYQKQAVGGSMYFYTNVAINKAIYCWIQGGSVQ
jgi:PBP1b-binding outer membrane lipoprotein LpoB